MLFCISLLMFTCQSDEQSTAQVQSNIQTVGINEARAFLAHSKNNSLAKSTKTELGNLEFDKATLEKLNGSDQLLTVIPLATNNEVRNDRVLVMKIDDEIRSVIFSMQPDENSTQDRFSGKVFIYSLEGDFITGYGAKDGIYIGQYLKEKSNSKTSKNPQDGEGGVLIIYYYKKPVNAVNATDFDAIWGSGGSSMGWAPVGGASGVTWDATGGGGGSGITAPTNEQITAELEKKIDGTNLDPCTQGVLDKLKNLKQGDIAKMITRFDSPKSTLNIYMSTGTPLKSENSPETTKISDYNYNIIMSSDYTKGVLEGEVNSPPTTLSIATTVAHEIFHAYLLSIVDEHNNGNSASLKSFPTLFDAYVKNKTPAGTTQSNVDAQHDVIASQYVNAIASTIEEFDTGTPVASGFPRQVYMDIAWAGLEGTYVFNKNYPNDQTNKNYADRNRILSRGSIERYNKPRGNQSPVGKPCN